jgi:hypothetical protein
MPRRPQRTAATIVPVAVFGFEVNVLNVCNEEAAAPVAVLERLDVVTEGARVGVEAAAAVELAPGSAKIVPNDGTKVEAEQQLPS